MPAPKQVAPRTPPIDQASYAGSAQAMELADELAKRHGLPAEWTRDALAQARHREVVTRLIMPAASPGSSLSQAATAHAVAKPTTGMNTPSAAYRQPSPFMAFVMHTEKVSRFS